MRSVHRESFRDANSQAEGTPRHAISADRTAIATPTALWLETVESMFTWYDAMFRLAFGVGRTDDRSQAHVIANSAPHSPGGMNGSGEAQTSIASPTPVPPTPAPSAPLGALQVEPTAPVKLRPKRKKTASRGKNKASSSKISSIKRRYRRAA